MKHLHWKTPLAYFIYGCGWVVAIAFWLAIGSVVAFFVYHGISELGGWTVALNVLKFALGVVGLFIALFAAVGGYVWAAEYLKDRRAK